MMSFDLNINSSNSDRRMPMKGDALFCLCNDNVECISKSIPGNFIPSETASKLGHCVTGTHGRCYTVKDIDLTGIDNDLGEFSPSHNYDHENRPFPPELDIRKFIRIRHGCLSSPSKITFSCNGHLTNHMIPKAIACCNSSDFCNMNLIPKFEHHLSDVDAVKTAFNNRRYVEKFRRKYRPLINRELNVGPNLLTGGEVVFGPGITQPTATEATSSHLLKVFNIALIIAFSSILVILLLLLASLYACYRRRLQRRKYKVCESLLWYSAMSANGQVGRLPSSVTNSWMSDHLDRKAKEINEYSRVTRQKENSGPSAFSTQTLSSHLTRKTDSCGESPIPNNFKPPISQSFCRTMGKQVTLECLIGKGRFSDVWKGTWRGEHIVVKVFTSSDRLSHAIWRRTASIHRSVLLRHRAIQGLMAVDWINYPPHGHQYAFPTDMINTAPNLRAMLISESYQWGTLKDLMSRFVWCCSSTAHDVPSTEPWSKDPVRLVHTLVPVGNPAACPILTTTDDLFLGLILRMAMSLTRGLCFLHSEFVGTRGKPALAHRDLKPSNVYVRSDWSLCIGDIGFCIRPPPNPLPLTLMELNHRFEAYVHQAVHTGSQQAFSTSLTPSETEKPVMMMPESFPMCQSFDGRSALGKLAFDRVDLLEWWPIGGLQIGTPRYMAPELLNNSATPFSFEGHQKADIYAMGLVLWEIFTWALPRSEVTTGVQAPHYPAYQIEWAAWLREHSSDNDTLLDESIPMLKAQVGLSTQLLPEEPDLWTMRHLVCDLNKRPQFPTLFSSSWDDPLQTDTPHRGFESVQRPLGHTAFPYMELTVTAHSMEKCLVLESSSSGASSLNGAQTISTATNPSDFIRLTDLPHLQRKLFPQLSKLLAECWTTDPDARLTALRIRKTIQRLLDQIEDTHSHDQKETETNLRTVCPGVHSVSSDSSTVKASS